MIKKGLFKKLKNIKNENEELLKAENKTENIKEITDFVDQPLNLGAKELIEEIRVIQKDVDYRKLNIRGGNNTDYDFRNYRTFKELFRDLYHKKITLDDAEANHIQIDTVLYHLDKYSPKSLKYIETKNNLVKNVKKITKGETRLLKGFKTEYSHLIITKRDKHK